MVHVHCKLCLEMINERLFALLTMFIKWHIVLHKRFKVTSMISHIFDCFSSVTGMWRVVSLNLIPQGPEQAISGCEQKRKTVCIEVRHRYLRSNGPQQISGLIWVNFLHEELKWFFMQIKLVFIEGSKGEPKTAKLRRKTYKKFLCVVP